MLNNLKDNKATNDTIPIKIFKLIPDNILLHLTELFNRSLKSGTFPDILKSSKIIPIHKQGSQSDCNNYRPISILSYIDKMLEKALCIRLHQFLNKINFFCSNQYGFRSNHNSEYALISLMDRIYKAIDKKQVVVLLSVDLRKAFDVIRYDILFDKLENLGIRETLLKWFQSYLTRRRQQTMINGVLSKCLEVEYGVPQGSSLGPLLYLIYFNDVKNVFSETDINVFADDTCLIASNNCIDEAMREMNDKIKRLERFTSANGIRINDKKTEYMIIQSKGKPLSHIEEELYYEGEKLRRTNEIKLLGIHIDATLSFRNFIENIMIKKLRKYIPIFYRLRQFMNNDCLIKIYFAQVHSILSYCILVYGNTCKSTIQCLEKLQIRILKFLFKISTSNVKTKMKQFKLLSWKQIYTFKLLQIAHATIYNRENLPKYFQKLYNTTPLRILRNKEDFIVPYYRTVMGQRSVDFVLSKEWNQLTRRLKDIQSPILFKRHIKNYLLVKNNK